MTKKERESAIICTVLFGLFFFCVILAVLMDKDSKGTDAKLVKAVPVSLTATGAAEYIVTAYCPLEQKAKELCK